MTEEKNDNKKNDGHVSPAFCLVTCLLTAVCGFGIAVGLSVADHNDSAFYKKDRDFWIENSNYWKGASRESDAKRGECLKDRLSCTNTLASAKSNLEICGHGFGALVERCAFPERTARRDNAILQAWKGKAESCQKEIDDRIADAKRNYQATETVLCFLEDGTGPGVQCHRFKKLVEGDVIKLSYGKLTVECDHGPDGYVIPSKCRVVK